MLKGFPEGMNNNYFYHAYKLHFHLMCSFNIGVLENISQPN